MELAAQALYAHEQLHAPVDPVQPTRARFDPNPKATFHRTRNKCKREYVLPEPE